MTLLHILAAGLLLATPTLARTDLSGCTSIQTMVTLRDEPGYGNTIASVLWYVPDTLEICDFVDCGGGRAPPKSVPGCPLYEGPETVTAQFLTRDPMAPSESAVQTEGAKETGSAAAGTSTAEEAVQTTQEGAPASTEAEAAETTEERDQSQITSAPTTIMTTTSKEADDAETSNSADEGAEESSTDAGSDEATTTGSDNPDETGAAGIVAVNMLGVAAAAFALF